MPKEMFTPTRFHKSSRAMITAANVIIGEYAAQGYELTIRQLYYQFVARDLLENKLAEYNRLKSVMSKARLAGLVDWSAIVDRTRTLRGAPHWNTIEEIVESSAAQFRYRRKWRNQPNVVEVWIEKDALIGVVERTCTDIEIDCDYFACRGYNSQSAQYRAAKRYDRYAKRGQGVILLHLGDHDPSGIDMTRDNRDRLELFSHANLEVRRIALNMDQVELYGPPANPAKFTDSRIEEYVAAHGYSSWELDALEPTVLDALIREHVEGARDADQWAEDREAEDEARAHLAKVAENWDEIETFLEDL